MERIAISLRKTHKYVDSYRHLDEEEYLGEVKVTPERKTEEGNGFDDLGTYVRFARIPVGMDKEKAIKALGDTLSNWGCAHEYDCCGCMLSSTSVYPTTSPRTLRLVSRFGRNY